MNMEEPENMDEVLKLWRIEDASLEFSLYDFSQIADASGNFSPKNILGEGGFGPVYKVFPYYYYVMHQCFEKFKRLHVKMSNGFCREYFLMDKR
jgi:hypothetical protein